MALSNNKSKAASVKASALKGAQLEAAYSRGNQPRSSAGGQEKKKSPPKKAPQPSKNGAAAAKPTVRPYLTQDGRAVAEESSEERYETSRALQVLLMQDIKGNTTAINAKGLRSVPIRLLRARWLLEFFQSPENAGARLGHRQQLEREHPEAFVQLEMLVRSRPGLTQCACTLHCTHCVSCTVCAAGARGVGGAGGRVFVR